MGAQLDLDDVSADHPMAVAELKRLRELFRVAIEWRDAEAAYVDAPDSDESEALEAMKAAQHRLKTLVADMQREGIETGYPVQDYGSMT